MFGIAAQIIALLVIIIIYDPEQIIYSTQTSLVLIFIFVFFLISLSHLGYIDFRGRNRSILLALLLIILATLFYFFCQAFTKDIKLLGNGRIDDSRAWALSFSILGFFIARLYMLVFAIVIWISKKS